MDPATRAEALVGFLLDREPALAEQAQVAAFGFDCDTFLVRLVCSDEVTERFGDFAQHLIDLLRSETQRDLMPHKLAHDLVLSKEELTKLQARLDGLNGQMIQLLKQEDRIAGLFDVISGIQADLNAMRRRLDKTEFDMMQGAGADDGD